VIIECTTCHARYQYDEARFDGKPSKKIKCAKCQTVFEIANPAHAPAGAPSPPPPRPADPDEGTDSSRHDSTRTARPKPSAESTEESPLPTPPTDQQSAEPALPPGKRLSLAIIDGPDAGSVVRIDKARFTIGRANADLTLNDTETSRQHAQIEVREGTILLLDLGSTNGTLLDGKNLLEPTEITDKTEFQIGSTVLMLIVTDDA
jgi:predicted Zn finger-like uncharacterized protein